MQITISITAPEGTLDQDLLTIDVGPDMTIADLKAYIQSDTNVPPAMQSLYHNGQELRDGSKTLTHCQVKENDMLAMLVQSSRVPTAGAGQGQARAPRLAERSQSDRRGIAEPDPEVIRLQALAEPRRLDQIRLQNPELADAVQDKDRFRQAWEAMARQAYEREAEKQRELALLNADPFNIEAQAKIEEIIRQQRVEENLQNALDYTPEAFGRVHMLYIDVEVNNNKVKAFVDSGAQATIMSPDCAEKCGIMRLIDKRYAGIAKGVGTAKILGRVHSAQIKIGDMFLACSFTVMEGKDVDLLLGLDMLKRHQACIDLQKGKLIIRNAEVPFLGEAEIPKHEELIAKEPTVEGPGGMKTGAISGAVSGASGSNFKGQGQTLGGAASPSTPSQTPAGPAAKVSSFPAGDIAQLVEMGTSREEAIHALEITEGNVEAAAGLLFG